MEPKYADVLEDLLHRTEVIEDNYTEMYSQLSRRKTLQNVPSSMNRTFTMITSELKNLRNLGEKEYQTETNSLEKISEKVFKRKKKRAHSKKDRQASLQYEL